MYQKIGKKYWYFLPKFYVLGRCGGRIESKGYLDHEKREMGEKREMESSWL